MKQVDKNRKFCQSIGHALNGLKTIMLEERNMRFHVLSAIAVVVCAWLLQCNALEWLWLLSCISFVLVIEVANTIAENLVDVLSEGQYFEWAKKIKDMAAGGVLISAIYAVIVALIIFVPKLIK